MLSLYLRESTLPREKEPPRTPRASLRKRLSVLPLMPTVALELDRNAQLLPYAPLKVRALPLVLQLTRLERSRPI